MAASAHPRRGYLIVFAALVALTALELLVAQTLKAHRPTMIALLIGLALTKAGCVALSFMHLAGERRPLKLLVAIPMALPPLFAVVLMLEAVWRHAAR